MLIHPWDAAHEESEWQQWLSRHDFGQLAVNGATGEPPFVQPLHFFYDGERSLVLAHLARPNPVWTALEAAPEVLLSVVDDYAFIPGPWQAPEGSPPEEGVPTSFYAAVQLRCTAHIVDDPDAKAALLQAQVDHFQPEGGSARVAAEGPPYGRLLSGIRGLRLEVTDVRAKFKYAGQKPESVRRNIAAGLAARGEGRDSGALDTQLGRMPGP
ncbi:MAG TPA: FMN-binding negative transcriptional regulator [Streptomyces sp.]|jgi:transcriptional regulator|nr:FMN-binding negative transcriptional regulator [Streptomyces sp.]